MASADAGNTTKNSHLKTGCFLNAKAGREPEPSRQKTSNRRSGLKNKNEA
jgi:hypothetical protein